MTTTKITNFGKTLVCMAAVILIGTWNIWAIFETPEQRDLVFGVGMALAIALLVWSIHLSANGAFRRYSLAFLILCISNVVDEAFFDPTTQDINEYISAAIIIMLAVFYNRITQINIQVLLYLKQFRLYLKKTIVRCLTKIGLKQP